MTVGTIAAASRITSGPVLGSVSEPLKTLPTRPWPAIHIKKESSAPAARNQPGRRATSGPRPIVTETAARIQAVWVPECREEIAEAGSRSGPYQPGVLSDMPAMALWIDEAVRLAGSRKSTAASDQYPAHTASGVIVRPMPWAAADEATPAGRSVQSTASAAAGGARP